MNRAFPSPQDGGSPLAGNPGVRPRTGRGLGAAGLERPPRWRGVVGRSEISFPSHDFATEDSQQNQVLHRIPQAGTEPHAKGQKASVL